MCSLFTEAYGNRSARQPSDNMFLLERIALLQEPMKVKIYISFYFVGLFFYLVTYWKKRQIFLVK